MSTQHRNQQQTPTTAPGRTRAPRRTQRGEAPVAAPRYVELGDGSRFEFALVGAAMVAMWVSLIAAIVSL